MKIITEDTITRDLSGFRDEFDTYLLEAIEVIEKMEDFDSTSQREWHMFHDELQRALDMVYDTIAEVKAR